MSAALNGAELEGDRDQIEMRLENLPIGTVIRCDDGTPCGLVYQKLHRNMLPWYETGRQAPVSSENIARHQVPIEVLR